MSTRNQSADGHEHTVVSTNRSFGRDGAGTRRSRARVRARRAFFGASGADWRPGTDRSRSLNSLMARVAIVTGASRGIGLAVAQELMQRGAKVCITARTPETLAEAVIQLGGSDVAIAVPGRADDADHQEEAVSRTIETFGRLDMLVYNTGINPYHGQVLDIDPQLAANIFAVNVLAPLAWVKRARDAGVGERGGQPRVGCWPAGFARDRDSTDLTWLRQDFRSWSTTSDRHAPNSA